MEGRSLTAARPIVGAEVFGRRLYVAGYRVHHGAVGIALTLLGAFLVYHDRRDVPWPFIDHPS